MPPAGKRAERSERSERSESSKRSRRRDLESEASTNLSSSDGNQCDEPECPVCMTRYNRDGSETFAFPCGHCVCSACDTKLQERAFYSCPTCREPRRGISRAQVDAAATARVQRDELRDRVANGRLSPGAMGAVEYNGQRYEIIFLPDESEGGTPFDVLRTVQGTAPGVVSRMVSRTPTAHRPPQMPLIDLTGDDDEAVEVPPPPPHLRGGVALPPVLAEMVVEMLQPTHLPQWLRRHNSLTAMVTGRENQPPET